MKLSLLILALAVSMAASIRFSHVEGEGDDSHEDVDVLVESVDGLVDSEGEKEEEPSDNSALAESLFAEEQARGMLYVL